MAFSISVVLILHFGQQKSKNNDQIGFGGSIMAMSGCIGAAAWPDNAFGMGFGGRMAMSGGDARRSDWGWV